MSRGRCPRLFCQSSTAVENFLREGLKKKENVFLMAK